jgi:hypothetical protein
MTFIPIIIIIHNWYLSSIQSFQYIHEYELQYTIIHGRIPLAFNLPFLLPLSSLLHPLLLTWNPPSCDRNRPPRSQVACKLTLPCPTLHPNPPPSKFPEPQLAQCPTKTTSGIFRTLLSGTRTILLLEAFVIGLVAF